MQCRIELIDASYRSSPSLQTSAVIVLCSVLLGLAVFIGVILVWKHKRKVQNFLPCKTSPQSNREGPATAGVIYEDLHEIMPRPTPQHHHPGSGHVVAPSIEDKQHTIDLADYSLPFDQTDKLLTNPSTDTKI
ncbi:hypothetical protein QE152_g5262 [Popillia japonica]|uniref:Uncharacterized protein n=1 Tax=Popillia japonica TaxID=7064 RepID=A0AAW1MQB7_POPJA